MGVVIHIGNFCKLVDGLETGSQFERFLYLVAPRTPLLLND